jgi:hypothetical protein
MDRSEHEALEPSGDETRRIEQALQQLQPRPMNLDRERLMFLAGQVAAGSAVEARSGRQRAHWLWPAATLAMGTIAACLLVALTLQLSRPPLVREVVREVLVPAPSPTLQAANPPNSIPPAISQYTSAPILSLPAGSVLQMRNTALRFGVEALPAGSGAQSTAPETSPLNIRQQLREEMGGWESLELEFRLIFEISEFFMNIKYLLIACMAFIGRSSLGTADDKAPPDPNQPTRIELTLSAAAEPRPALKYSLAIGSRERNTGNAALFYHRALLTRRSIPTEHLKKHAEQDQAWSEGPLDAQKIADIKAWLTPYGATFRELKVAVYRDHCDWDQRLQDLKGMEVINFLLPEMQECRDLARALRLRARVEIAERRYDDAIETLRWGFQLGKDCGEQPLLISNLVGIAITSVMIEPLVELIEAPDSPNLFWAIAALPQPLIDVRKALEFERGFPEQIFPFLKDAETVNRSPQEWQRILEETVTEIGKLSSDLQMANANNPVWLQKAGLMLMLVKTYPAAKAELIAQGLDAKKVEAMSVAQVVAIQTSRRTREAYDDVFKAMLLPYPESLKVTAQVEALRKRQASPNAFFGTQGLPIAQMIMPATLQVKRAEIRGPRQFAVLQVVEAIRMHAAATGKLPATLGEIKVVPVPPNPITREPFPYTLKGSEAVLEMPVLADEQPRNIGKRYIMTLRH